jgi:hypothetical protein
MIGYYLYTDNLSINSASEEEVEFKPVRLSRSNIKSDQQHPKIRSTSLYSQSMNNVSFMSDISKNGRKSSKNRSSGQLKKVNNPKKTISFKEYF